MKEMVLVSAWRDRAAAAEVARSSGGVLIASSKDGTDHLPLDSLVVSATDDVAGVVAAADVGAWLACERVIKHSALLGLDESSKPGSVGVFTMVANPAMGAKASDAHWRDNHAPLALEIHTAMTHYYQLSLQHCFKGDPDWTGFALCCFANEDDLRNKFYNSKEGERRIAEDVNKFADTRRSPRRVISTLQTNS